MKPGYVPALLPFVGGAAAGAIAGASTAACVNVAGVSLRGLFPCLGAPGDADIGIVALPVSLATRGATATSREQSA